MQGRTGQPSRSQTLRGHFLRGMGDGAVTLLAITPFGVMFGALAAAAGLDLAQTMAMTAVVFAGASQLAALQLMTEQAPFWMVVATGTVVNLRMAMYSAAMAQRWRGAPLRTRLAAAFFLHDVAFGLAAREADRRPTPHWRDQISHYAGVGLTTSIGWLGGGLVGALLGGRAPASLALEYAAPLMFLAIIGPMLRTAPHVAAAATATAAALALAWLPLGLGLLAGALLGVAAGAGLEAAMERRR